MEFLGKTHEQVIEDLYDTYYQALKETGDTLSPLRYVFFFSKPLYQWLLDITGKQNITTSIFDIPILLTSKTDYFYLQHKKHKYGVGKTLYFFCHTKMVEKV